jgi:hypothetical protein
MFPSIDFSIILFLLLILTTKSISDSLKSIVIQVKGDCQILGDKIAQENGYRYVRQVWFFYDSIKSHNFFRSLMVIVK